MSIRPQFDRYVERIQSAASDQDLRSIFDDLERDLDHNMSELTEEQWPVISAHMYQAKARIDGVAA